MKTSACSAASLVLLVVTMAPTEAPRLVQPGDFRYEGAFRLPAGATDQESFDYGGTALAYYAAHDSLLLVGHDWYQRVAEIGIPKPAGSVTPDELPTAAIRQPLVDVLEGQRGRVGEGTAKIGGLLVSADAVIVTAYLYYDAVDSQVLSHFRSGLDLARSGDVQGPYAVGGDRAGFVSGYMTPIPVEWQPALGGSALTGQCCLSIISRTSLGPAASVFTPPASAASSPLPATPVLRYPIKHPTLGGCDARSPFFNCTTMMAGAIFPPGTRSVLFFGRHGLGPYCYGEAGPAGPCNDPASSSKGSHAYPYAHQIWAYDAGDFLAVKNGKKQPWEIRPYRAWTFELPFQHPSRQLNGVTYDPATKRVFISQAYGDGNRPLIHVYTLAG